MQLDDLVVAHGTVYSERPIGVFDIPLAEAVALLRPEEAMLRFGRDCMDVGALCYLRRSDARRKGSNDGRHHPRLVDLGSFDPHRAKQVMTLIYHISALVTEGGYRVQTVHSEVGTLIRFVDWADTNGQFGALSGNGATYAAFGGYVGYLRERVNRDEISLSSACKEQWMVHKFLAGLTGLHDLHRGLNMLDTKGVVQDHTEPPPESDVAKAESLCEALFLGFSELVLDKKPYPFKLPMPKYLGWEEDFLWVFPVRRWCMPPYQLEIRHEFDKPFWAYDYQKGRLATPEEIRPHYRDPWTSRWLVENAEEVLAAANTDFLHSHRIKSAMSAHNAFMVLFLGQTGMNLSVACALQWGTEYVVGTAQQGFRELKWRAGGKVYSTVIRMTFLPLFKRFIELRAYLLDGRPCETLFFTLGSNRQKAPGPATHNAVETTYSTLQLLDPEIKWVRARKLRAAKQDFHIRNSEPAIAAQVMGHSEETATKKYSAGSKTTHYEEVSAFFDKVQQAAVSKAVILRPNEELPDGREGHVGSCAKFQCPQAISDQVPVQPDCDKLEGCLFCDKHRVHPDERDTRKLASCAHVLQQATYLPGAEVYFQPVLERIQSILDEVKALEGNAEMVVRVIREVDEDGELDPYWAEKLALLNELEIAL